MTSLDRFIIRAILDGRLEFDRDSPRFARVYDLRRVRPYTERWALATGCGGVSVPLGRIADLCMKVAQSLRHSAHPGATENHGGPSCPGDY